METKNNLEKSVQTEKEETIIQQCNYCGKDLKLPLELHKRLVRARSRPMTLNLAGRECNKQYNGFYISPGGIPYCDKNCFTMYTED